MKGAPAMDDVIRTIQASDPVRTHQNDNSGYQQGLVLPITVRFAAVLGCLLVIVTFARSARNVPADPGQTPTSKV
jgi:hypothetical protein